MGDVSGASRIALSVGGAALVAAGVVALLHRTRGAPPIRRMVLMAGLACSAAGSALPSRQVVAAVTAGGLAFAGSLTVGLGITVLVIWAIPPEVPNPTEAYEGFGDAVRALGLFGLGVILSLCAAVGVGFVVGERVASLTVQRPTEPGAAPDPAT